MVAAVWALLLGQAGLVAFYFLTLPGPPSLRPHATIHKNVVITGGTGGLGAAAVALFAERGDTVYTCGRNSRVVSGLNSEARQAAAVSALTPADEEASLLPPAANIHASVVDIRKPEEVAEWAASLKAKGVIVDVLLNNAGVLRVGDPAAAITMEAYDEVMDTNVRGCILATTAFWPMMRRRSKSLAPGATGMVINMGSTTETPKLAQAFHSIYSISKVALRAYSTGLRQEGQLAGVDVVHVRAGAFASNLHGAFEQAGVNLAQYQEFAGYAAALQRGILDKVKLVTEKSEAEFAELIYSIAHTQGTPAAEYWLNVSWLEWLAEWLPQSLLDRVIAEDYKVPASVPPTETEL